MIHRWQQRAKGKSPRPLTLSSPGTLGTKVLNVVFTPPLLVVGPCFQVTGAEYAETDAHMEGERGAESTAGGKGGGDRLGPVLEAGRSSVLHAVSTAASGLLHAKHEFWSVGVVASFVFGVVFAAAATAGTLLFRTFLL